MLNDLSTRNGWIWQYSIQRSWRKWQNDRRLKCAHTYTHMQDYLVKWYKPKRFFCAVYSFIIGLSGQRIQLKKEIKKWKMRNKKISKAGWDHMRVCVHMCEQFCSGVDAGRHGSTVSPWANRHHGLSRFRHTSKNKQLERKHLHPIPCTFIHRKQT